MKIAFLLHFYPPSPCGGAGYFTASLAEALQSAGHTVGVLCVDRWGQGKHYLNGTVDEIRNGVHVRRLYVNWKKAPRPFDWLHDSPVLGEQARIFLTQFQPDIVHISSCYTLSARPVHVAKEMGLPIVMHLHDYWTICARLTLLHKDNTICSGPESAWKCQRCLLANTNSWQFTNALMQEPLQQRLFETLAEFDWATRLPSLHGMLGNTKKRAQYIADACKKADVLVTPTTFARDLLTSYGIVGTSIRVIPYGNDVAWADSVNRTLAPHLRIGFLGNLTSIKGVHVLISAYKILLRQKQPVHLAIWGNPNLDGDYYQALRNMSPNCITWGGRYERDDLPQILENLDVVVMPSICYETQGIVIQEAFAAGLPVVVSDNSSFTETVVNEVNGLHFQMGSPEDLADKLKRLIMEPDLLDRFRANIPAVRTTEEDVEEYSALYSRLIQEFRG